MKFYAEIQQGKMIFTQNQRDLMAELVRVINTGFVELTLKKVANGRTTKQNSFYWGAVIAPLTFEFNELGNDYKPDDVHEFLKNLFLQDEKDLIDKATGEIVDTVKYTKSTTKLSTEEFWEYCEKIRIWALEKLEIELNFENIGNN